MPIENIFNDSASFDLPRIWNEMLYRFKNNIKNNSRKWPFFIFVYELNYYIVYHNRRS